jgi:hypothetical protein
MLQPHRATHQKYVPQSMFLAASSTQSVLGSEGSWRQGGTGPERHADWGWRTGVAGVGERMPAGAHRTRPARCPIPPSLTRRAWRGSQRR